LGGPFTPLLSSPKSPYQADVLVIESTYGDKNHVNKEHRKQQLKRIIEHCLRNRGAVLVPAFSIGRTQELLYELEEIIFRSQKKAQKSSIDWADLDIFVDSPLANQFTEVYKKLRPFWDAEARVKISDSRHPLSFEQLTTINSHKDHLDFVAELKKSARPSASSSKFSFLCLQRSSSIGPFKRLGHCPVKIRDKIEDFFFQLDR
jgi:metallo-beta-lactamase family protein